MSMSVRLLKPVIVIVQAVGAYLMEDGSSFYLMEDGTSKYLLQ